MNRRWLLWVLLAAFVWLVVTRVNEIENLAALLAQGVWWWLLVAGALQLFFFVVQARVYQLAFALVGVRSRLWELVPVLLGAMFVNAVAPAGGTAGLALMVDEATQRGQSGARTTVGALLAIITLYLGFAIIVVGSLIYMALNDLLQWYIVLTALALLGLTLLLGGLLGLGWWQPARLRQLLQFAQDLVNRLASGLRRPSPLAETWAAQTASEFQGAAAAVQARPRALLPLLFWSLVVHLVNAASLYTVFLAFQTPVGASALLAGFAVGHLFAIMAPTPQGVGFVETIMPLVFTGAGIASAAATVAVLAYRGLSFWLPLLAGFFLLQRLKSLGAEEKALTEVWTVRLIALLITLLGFLHVLTALTPVLVANLQPVTRYAPLSIYRSGQIGAGLSGFALLFLGHGLWRRKRAAWYLTLVVLLLAALSNLMQAPFRTYRLVLSLLLALLLFFQRPHFHARSDPPSVRQGIRVTALALSIVFLYGAFGLYLLSLAGNEPLSLPAAMGMAVVMILSLTPPPGLLLSDAGWLLAITVYTLAAVTLGYALFLLLRPVLVRRPASARERRRAEHLLQRYGRLILGSQFLAHDRSYFFSPGGSVLAYRMKRRTALVLEGPVGPPEDMAPAIAAFTRFCMHNDWSPVFYQVPAADERLYRDEGYRLLAVGREAIVRTQQENGSGTEEVRVLQEAGYRAYCLEPPHSRTLVERLCLIDDQWLSMIYESSETYAISQFDKRLLRDLPLVVVKTPEGMVSAYAPFALDHGQNQLRVGAIRHRPEIAAGTAPLLFDRLLAWATATQVAEISLGAVPASGQDLDGVEQIWPAVYLPGDAPFGLVACMPPMAATTLRWQPRYLAYPPTRALRTIWQTLDDSGSGPLSLLRSRSRSLYN